MARRATSILLVLILAVVLAGDLPEVHGASSDQPAVHKVKAGLLYHLASLVAWPENGSEVDESPIILGFVGNDSHGLARFFVSQAPAVTPKGRRLIVRMIPRAGSGSSGASLSAFARKLQQCHIIYFTKTTQRELSHLLDSLDNTNVLTVSETESFLQAGGMVSLLVKQECVTIHVNLNAVQRADLKISAQLLQHAVIVDGQ